MPLILKIGCTHECQELSSQGIVSIQHVSVSGGHATPTFGRHRKIRASVERKTEPRKSKDQTLPIGSRESFTWIILKTILCLVLDFQGECFNIFQAIPARGEIRRLASVSGFERRPLSQLDL